jgi:hypothetical protein
MKYKCLLICTSFITREVEHFFMYLLVICTSFFENSLFNLLHPFLYWDVDYLGVEFFEFPVDSGCWSFIGYESLPFCGLCLKCSDCDFCCAKAL